MACESPTSPTALVYADRTITVPSQSRGWTAISVGGSHSCGIRTGGALRCWGANGSGQLGVRVTRGRCDARACEAVPVAVALPGPVTMVSAGERHSCALGASGEAYCWGENLQYQVGVEAESFVRVPTVVAPALRFVDVSAGATHSCAVRTNGVVYCWGEGRLGALGRADTLSSVIPQPIASDERFLRVSAGRWRSCAVATNGSLWCWGSEWESSKGNTDYFHERLTPHRVDGAPAMRSVSVSAMSICGVTLLDRALCWEANGFGQLGTGTLEGSTVPTAVATQETFTSVSAGILQSCALTPDGDAFCWGNDTFGQLGRPRTGEWCGALECRRSPAPVFGRLRFTSVATGLGTHTCGITVESAAVCWGLGVDGQLGDGWTRERQSLPVGVAGVQ
jgi:alpha-tubulin suppressor-like RCC1 family protein